MLVAGGSTNVTTYFVLRLAADGTAATGLTVTNFDLQYTRSGVAPTAKVDATALGATDTAHTDNYAIEIDATDQPGLYRVDWPDAAFAAGVREVILSVKCATAFTEHLRCEIDGEVNVVEWAGTDVVAGAIPAVVADGAGGLPISDGGGLDLDAILVDTGTTLQAELDAIQAAVITNAAGSDIAADIIALKAETVLIVEDTGTTVPGLIAALDAVVDTVKAETVLILADTAELQSDDTPAAIAALNDPTVAEIADAVWDELRSGHTTNGTFGQNTQADITKVNGTSVTGDGESGTEWGPA